jgi:hypothetical protein
MFAICIPSLARDSAGIMFRSRMREMHENRVVEHFTPGSLRQGHHGLFNRAGRSVEIAQSAERFVSQSWSLFPKCWGKTPDCVPPRHRSAESRSGVIAAKRAIIEV